MTENCFKYMTFSSRNKNRFIKIKNVFQNFNTDTRIEGNMGRIQSLQK